MTTGDEPTRSASTSGRSFVEEPLDLQEHILATYFDLRIGIAVLGFLLPIVLAVGGGLLGIPLQGSMSAYYHALPVTHHAITACDVMPSGTLRNEFVGALIAVGALLFLYKGFSRSENFALNLAGIFAVLVALVPMAWPPCEPDSGWSLHGTVATLFFLCIAYVAVFRSHDTLTLLDPRRVPAFRRAYAWLGFAMVASPVAAIAFNEFLVRSGGESSRLFFIEAFGVWAFAAYWTVKSIELRLSSAMKLATHGELRRLKAHRTGRPDDAIVVRQAVGGM